MRANGYRHKKRKNNREKPQRFEASRPLELVQMDILEFFINKLKVYLILMLDDFSRFICGFRLLTETSSDAVIELVSQSIDRYGKMQEIWGKTESWSREYSRGRIWRYFDCGVGKFELRIYVGERLQQTVPFVVQGG